MLIRKKRLKIFLRHINLSPENALICKDNKSQINKINQIGKFPSILHQEEKIILKKSLSFIQSFIKYTQFNSTISYFPDH